jgi:hypothetical protein
VASFREGFSALSRTVRSIAMLGLTQGELALDSLHGDFSQSRRQPIGSNHRVANIRIFLGRVNFFPASRREAR